MAALLERFMKHVRKTDSCWEWTGSGDRYGTFNIGGKIRTTHRVSYLLHVGPIPEGACVLHKCDNPRCVRPDHLFLGSQVENLEDMRKKGRAANGERSGHNKLTLDQAVAIIRDKSHSGREWATKLGLGHDIANSVRRGESWPDAWAIVRKEG